MRRTWIYRGACVIIERDDGKVLLQLRDKNAWIYPNCWAFVGGGVEKGESPYQAMRREHLEELGHPLHGHRLFSVAWHRKKGRRVLDHTFIVRWRPRNICLREGCRTDWFSLKEALAMNDLPEHERYDLTKLRAQRQILGRIPLAA
jgi:8-oxo-dGTP pyrophosphatase MutT (NUDIX family)